MLPMLARQAANRLCAPPALPAQRHDTGRRRQRQLHDHWRRLLLCGRHTGACSSCRAQRQAGAALRECAAQATSHTIHCSRLPQRATSTQIGVQGAYGPVTASANAQFGGQMQQLTTSAGVGTLYQVCSHLPVHAY